MEIQFALQIALCALWIVMTAIVCDFSLSLLSRAGVSQDGCYWWIDLVAVASIVVVSVVAGMAMFGVLN